MSNQVRRVVRSVAWVGILASCVSASQGALVAHEQFNYNTGNLTGNNGQDANSSGWSGAWVSNGSFEVTQVVTSPGLTYPGLLTAGNAASDDQTNTAKLSSRPFDATGLTADGAVLWYSFLFNVPAVGGNSGLGRVKLFAHNSHEQGVGVNIGANGTGTTATLVANIREGQNPSGKFGTYTFNLGETYLVVGRIDFTSVNNGDQNRIWVNPSLTAEPVVGTEDSRHLANIHLTGSGPGGGGWMIRGDTSWRGTVDELRVGTTFADVILPIPEPSSFFLATLGSCALLARRRGTRQA